VAGLEIAVTAGVDVLAHPIDDTRGFRRDHLTALKDAGMALVPTLRLFRGLPEALDQVRDYSRIGGDILFGTDVGYVPDFDHAEEYELMAAAGLGWREVLASLTTTPARRFKEESARGRVAPGMTGDLVVLGADPIFGVGAFARVRYTIRRGRIIFSAADAVGAAALNARLSGPAKAAPRTGTLRTLRTREPREPILSLSRVRAASAAACPAP
jgi:imidazolonepropionase-like amidohydrolase